MNVAVRVSRVTKKYRIGTRHPYGRTLREAITDAVRSPFRSLTSSSPDASGDIHWALDDVSFDVGTGEVVGIIGENGAGKSTLLKILSRITDPTRGRIEIHGRVASLLEVGTGFHPDLTGRENVFLNGAILGMRREETRRKFDAIVAFAEVERFIDTQVKHYSSGMYMRLAFAVAAHLEPEILIVDEVLAVGDAAFQRKCLEKMDDVSHGGRTVLFVSHNMHAIRTLCRDAIWLEKGKIAGKGPANAVVNSYLQHVTSQRHRDTTASIIRSFPPDPDFRLRGVSITQVGEERAIFSSGEPIEIGIEYDVLAAIRGLHVYFSVHDLEGTMLFESLHNGAAGEPMPLVAQGSFVSRATIPADVLNGSTYEIRINAAIADLRVCIPHPIRLLIEVVSSGHINRAYPGYVSPGKLALVIPWQTTNADGKPAG